MLLWSGNFGSPFYRYVATAAPITYTLGWTGSGSYSFNNETFQLKLTGDISDVKNEAGNTIIEGLNGAISGPSGVNGILTNQFLGIQPVGHPGQSVVWGVDSHINLDADAVGSGLSTYNLISTIGPRSLTGVLFEPRLSNLAFTDAGGFTFQASTAGTVSEPSTLALLLLGLGAVGFTSMVHKHRGQNKTAYSPPPRTSTSNS